MLPFDEARERLLLDVRAVGTERVALAQTSSRVLAESLVAGAALPRFDHSAMDGYAVRAADFPASPPFEFAVAGESRAGGETARLPVGAACRIFTGAKLPDGADAVVMQEEATRTGARVTFAKRAAAGAFVRRAGQDLAEGAIAMAKGTRIDAAKIAIIGMLDRAEIVVFRRPLVVIVATGDELRTPGQLRRGSADDATIPESNAYAIAALAEQAGARVAIAPLAKDDLEATTAALAEALRGADLLVTIGGVSVGDHDVVRPALERAGVTLDFWRVAMRPGKPIAVGRAGRGADSPHVLGLPGNPASAVVTFVLFGVPLLRAMQGDRAPFGIWLPARLGASHPRNERLTFSRVAIGVDPAVRALVATPLANQASGAATSLANSDGVARIAQGEGTFEMGADVDVLRWADA